MDAATARRTVQARFAAADPELQNGFAEHAPMGADALLALGLDPEAVVRWAARHSPRELAADGAVAERRAVLLDELGRRPWDDVVRAETSRLAPHVGAHLFHGLIRTAHAVRGLRQGVDEVGLAELATGLAAWHVWADRPARAPLSADIGRAVADPTVAILDAARRGAGACAASPSIMTLHAVTAPMAFLLVADLLDAATVTSAAQAFGRTHARHPEPRPSATTLAPDAPRIDSLLGHWDAHPAKLTEAALRGWSSTGDGVFLDAIGAIMGA